MAKKKKIEREESDVIAPIAEQPITETLETNYMPYVMSVIVSRALPEIDGFKPAHRKLLYTMYKMGLLTGSRTKSANIVGQTMKLNPHGDAAIYETMVRLTRGCEALLHPFVDSKGSFGKQYSRDMAYAASRYTEAKLDTFCNEIFRGIEKDAVDFVPNYDGTMEEPVLLPTGFPNILVSPNLGIAVGMMCQICSFNLAEICDGTIALLKNPDTSLERMMDIIKAPDFPGGAIIEYNREEMEKIFLTGLGGFTVRARYAYDAGENAIDILEIPYNTTIEPIMSRITDMMKNGDLKDVSDFRDAIDLSGFKLTLDLKRGTDENKRDALMRKLFRSTTLRQKFECNFNVLINGVPRTLGVIDILKEWIEFRKNSYARELTFDLNKKKEKQMLLNGLKKILVDLDKAIRIIRGTEKEEDVVPNLMEAFHLNKEQAEYVAEIKLRHINREYIFNRIKELEQLQADIAEMENILGSDRRLKDELVKQLKEIKQKYGKPRKSEIEYEPYDIGAEEDEEEADTDAPAEAVRLLLTRDGYCKKLLCRTMRANEEQKTKESDEIVRTVDTENKGTLLVFTNKAQVYKLSLTEIETHKAAQIGDYLPAKLKMQTGEVPVGYAKIDKYIDAGHMLFLFENGKAVRVPMVSYETKGARRCLSSAFSAVSPLVAAIQVTGNEDITVISNDKRALIITASLIPELATRSSGGQTLMKFGKKTEKLVYAAVTVPENFERAERYRKTALAEKGRPLTEKDEMHFRNLF